MAKRVSLKGKGAELFFGALPVDLSAAEIPSDDAPQPLPEPPEIVLVDETASPPPEAPQQEAAQAEPDESSTATAPEGPRRRSSAKASVLASTLARAEEAVASITPGPPAADVIETIRKTVKQPGREVSFVRLTAAEKGQLADIVYTYKRQGLKTSENEINRIAVNYLIDDYHQHGEQSVLAQVLAALRA